MKRRRSIDLVVLNVGGTKFETSAATLARCSSYFERMFSGDWHTLDDEVWLDMDADSFKVLLSCMRRRTVLLPEDPDLFARALLDAEYLGCDWLIDEVKQTVQRRLGVEATADAFDTQHGGLRDALRNSAVLPGLFFHSPAPKDVAIKQIVQAGEFDRLDFMGERSADGPIVKRIACYALVEREGKTTVEPVLSHHMDEEAHASSEGMLNLASEFASGMEGTLVPLGVSRYAPAAFGFTTRSSFTHRVLREPITPGERPSMEEQLQRLGQEGYRAISSWSSPDGEARVLMEKATPRHAAAQ